MNTDSIENLPDEEWRPIKGYENLYCVSNKGRVKSLGNNKTRKEKILKQKKLKSGYLYVNLCKDSKRKNFLIHRLVAEAFIPNPCDLPQVQHLDENKENNCLNNLCWCTVKENINYGTRNKRVQEKLGTKIKCFNLQTNKLTIYPSVNEAARQFNINSMIIWHKLYRDKNNIYKNRYIFTEA